MVRRIAWLQIAVVGLAVVAVAAGFVADGYPQQRRVDRTCHNPFKDTHATVIHSNLNIVLQISPTEWPEFRRFMQTFATKRGWSDRDASKTVPNAYKRLFVDICSEDSPRIEVNRIIWNDHPPYVDFTTKQIQIGFYADMPAQQWQAVARDFVNALRRKWPERVEFMNGGGVLIRPPAYLHLH